MAKSCSALPKSALWSRRPPSGAVADAEPCHVRLRDSVDVGPVELDRARLLRDAQPERRVDPRAAADVEERHGARLRELEPLGRRERDGHRERGDRGDEVLPERVVHDVGRAVHDRRARLHDVRQRLPVRELGERDLREAAEVRALALDEELAESGVSVTAVRDRQESKTHEPVEQRSGAARRDAGLPGERVYRIGAPRRGEDRMSRSGSENRGRPAAAGSA